MPYTVVIDYAHEPHGLESVYQVARSLAPKHLIAVLGAAGGGRDKSKRPTLGALAGRYADTVIVTNEDPYDEDPSSIIEGVADGAAHEGKRDGVNLFRILERRDAIAHALTSATRGDLVLITGKGSEQTMAVAGGKKVPWSDHEAVLSILHVDNREDKGGEENSAKNSRSVAHKKGSQQKKG